MHYPKNAFSINGQDTIQRRINPSGNLGNRNGLSEWDVKGLNLLYSCPGADGGTDTDDDTDDGSETDGDTDTGGGKNEDCKDDNAQCTTWAGRGECNKNPNYMLVSCKLSCKQCGKFSVRISFYLEIPFNFPEDSFICNVLMCFSFK